MKFMRTAALALSLGSLAAIASAQATAVPATAVPHAIHGVMGTVTSATNGSYTVTPLRNPTPVTFTTDNRTKVFVNTPSSLNALQTNEWVQVVGRTGGTADSMNAMRIAVLSKTPPKVNREKLAANGRQLHGVITSLSPLQVTVGNNPPVVVTLNTTARTRVSELDPGDLTAVVPNVRIMAEFDRKSATPVARRIVVMGNGTK